MRHLSASAAPLVLALLALPLLLPLAGCSGAKEPAAEPAPKAAPLNTPPKGPSGPRLPIVAPKAGSFKKAKKGYVPMCAGERGVIKDDGQLETGYGYVPSATSGIYLQEYSADEFTSPDLERVCVCWLHKRDDTEIDFEVVFYEKKEGKPAEEPYATRPGKAKDVPLGKESGGLFYDVDVSGVKLVPGTSYIGVRWNPSVDPFFFVCADHSKAGESQDGKVTAGYQREDRAAGWLAILGSPDPIFSHHKAMMLRAVAKPAGKAEAAAEPVVYNKSIKRKVAPPVQEEKKDEQKTPPR